MRDEFGNEVTTLDVVAGFESDLESVFWPVLTDDAEIDDDVRAEVTRKMEEAEALIKEARKILTPSSDTE